VLSLSCFEISSMRRVLHILIYSSSFLRFTTIDSLRKAVLLLGVFDIESFAFARVRRRKAVQWSQRCRAARGR
jgi:hypothetical protein